jgi:hypothetical protein
MTKPASNNQQRLDITEFGLNLVVVKIDDGYAAWRMSRSYPFNFG